MVKLTKIYTRTGDEGMTGLSDFSRTRKTDPRIEAYADVDEANSAIGVAISLAKNEFDEKLYFKIVELDLLKAKYKLNESYLKKLERCCMI